MIAGGGGGGLCHPMSYVLFRSLETVTVVEATLQLCVFVCVLNVCVCDFVVVYSGACLCA